MTAMDGQTTRLHLDCEEIERERQELIARRRERDDEYWWKREQDLYAPGPVMRGLLVVTDVLFTKMPTELRIVFYFRFLFLVFMVGTLLAGAIGWALMEIGLGPQ